MTIQIADTSQGVFIFCDHATAKEIAAQLWGQSPQGKDGPDGVFVIGVSNAEEIVPLETAGTLPAIEPDQEALREAVSRIRGR